MNNLESLDPCLFMLVSAKKVLKKKEKKLHFVTSDIVSGIIQSEGNKRLTINT